jgi:hypothetical protein
MFFLSDGNHVATQYLKIICGSKLGLNPFFLNYCILVCYLHNHSKSLAKSHLILQGTLYGNITLIQQMKKQTGRGKWLAQTLLQTQVFNCRYQHFNHSAQWPPSHSVPPDICIMLWFTFYYWYSICLRYFESIYNNTVYIIKQLK